MNKKYKFDIEDDMFLFIIFLLVRFLENNYFLKDGKLMFFKSFWVYYIGNY